MSSAVKLVPVQEAYDDLLNRTLARIPCDLGRLIYLASTRDYNTGNYYHEGLANRFRAEVARKALEIATGWHFTDSPPFRWRVWSATLRPIYNLLGRILGSSCARGRSWSHTVSPFLPK